MHSRLRPSPATVIALIALFVSLGGTAAALSGQNTVFSDDIVNGQVLSPDVRNDAIRSADLANLAGLQLQSSTSPAGGIRLGTDTNLYRVGPSSLRTDDNLVVAGPKLSVPRGSVEILQDPEALGPGGFLDLWQTNGAGAVSGTRGRLFVRALPTDPIREQLVVRFGNGAVVLATEPP